VLWRFSVISWLLPGAVCFFLTACGQAGTFEVPGCHTYDRDESSFVKICGEHYDHARWLTGIQLAFDRLHLLHGGDSSGVEHVAVRVFDAEMDGLQYGEHRVGGLYQPAGGGHISLFPKLEDPDVTSSAICHEYEHAFDDHKYGYHPEPHCNFEDLSCHFSGGEQSFDRVRTCSRHVKKVLGSRP
jgi:hypothetical protein